MAHHRAVARLVARCQAGAGSSIAPFLAPVWQGITGVVVLLSLPTQRQLLLVLLGGDAVTWFTWQIGYGSVTLLHCGWRFVCSARPGCSWLHAMGVGQGVARLCVSSTYRARAVDSLHIARHLHCGRVKPSGVAWSPRCVQH